MGLVTEPVSCLSVSPWAVTGTALSPGSNLTPGASLHHSSSALGSPCTCGRGECLLLLAGFKTNLHLKADLGRDMTLLGSCLSLDVPKHNPEPLWEGMGQLLRTIQPSHLGEGAKEMARERGEAKPCGQGQDWQGKQNFIAIAGNLVMLESFPNSQPPSRITSFFPSCT